MPTTPRFRVNAAGVRAIAMSAEIQAACLDVARKGAAYAASTAPRESGSLAGSYEAVPVTENVSGSPRAGARIQSSDPAAVPVEFGNKRTAGKHVLAKTVDHLQGGAAV